MRVVAGVLAVSLFAPFARADDAATAELRSPPDVARSKVPLCVVRVLPDSHQALLFDRARATHILAEVGGKIDGYTVEAIDEDEVTLGFEGRQIVLAAPARGGNRHHERNRPAAQVRSAADASQTDTTASGPMPIDPYGEIAVPVVEAPGAPDRGPDGYPATAIEAGEGGVRVAAAPGSATPPSSPAGAPGPEAGAPGSQPAGIRVAEAPTGTPTPAASDVPTASGAVVLTRGEVDGALADFARLATALRGSFSASGLVIDGVCEGTIFQHAGLRAGDVITAVDGARLRSLDDAADLYARASTARAITAQIVRGGKPMTLRVAIQ